MLSFVDDVFSQRLDAVVIVGHDADGAVALTVYGDDGKSRAEYRQDVRSVIISRDQEQAVKSLSGHLIHHVMLDQVFFSAVNEYQHVSVLLAI